MPAVRIASFVRTSGGYIAPRWRMCGFLRDCHLGVIHSVLTGAFQRSFIEGGHRSGMTYSTLIIVNATLGLVLVYALVHFLAQAIRADGRHRAVRAAEIRSLPSRERDRVAA